MENYAFTLRSLRALKNADDDDVNINDDDDESDDDDDCDNDDYHGCDDHYFDFEMKFKEIKSKKNYYKN